MDNTGQYGDDPLGGEDIYNASDEEVQGDDLFGDAYLENIDFGSPTAQKVDFNFEFEQQPSNPESPASALTSAGPVFAPDPSLTQTDAVDPALLADSTLPQPDQAAGGAAEVSADATAQGPSTVDLTWPGQAGPSSVAPPAAVDTAGQLSFPSQQPVAQPPAVDTAGQLSFPSQPVPQPAAVDTAGQLSFPSQQQPAVQPVQNDGLTFPASAGQFGFNDGVGNNFANLPVDDGMGNMTFDPLDLGSFDPSAYPLDPTLQTTAPNPNSPSSAFTNLAPTVTNQASTVTNQASTSTNPAPAYPNPAPIYTNLPPIYPNAAPTALNPPATANPTTPTSPHGVTGRVDGKKINHNRKLRLDPSNDPSEIYQKLPAVPAWGTLNTRRKPKFQYWHGGPELYPNLKLTKEDLVEFFLGQNHPGPRDFTIWIQNTPAQVNSRYQAGPDSAKCRYAGCPAKGGTILKGFLRVAFDENATLTSTGVADPFHNAGYMHLFCFEEVFDVGFMVHYAKQLWGFDVRIDARNLEGESRNPMSIRRDHDSIVDYYSDWMQERLGPANAKFMTVLNQNDPSLMDAERPFNKRDCLWRRLTEKHLELEVKGRRETRQKRGGANIDLHKGDLRKYLGLKETMKQNKRGAASDDEGPEERPAKRQRPAVTVPQDQLHMLHNQQGSPRTRKRSRDTEDAVRQVLATSPRLTRQTAHEIIDLLEDEPEHVRTRLLSEFPEQAQTVLQAAQEPRVYVDKLEERVRRLPKRQRLNVSEYTSRQETLKDPRKHFSV